MPTLIRHEGIVTEIVGDISDRDVGRAERLVTEHAHALREAWERLHGKR